MYTIKAVEVLDPEKEDGLEELTRTLSADEYSIARIKDRKDPILVIPREDNPRQLVIGRETKQFSSIIVTNSAGGLVDQFIAS